MSSQLNDNAIQEQLKELLRFHNDTEKLQFEAEKIHLDVMYQVRLLMSEHGMNKKMLAERLDTSKGYISQLFSGDKLINLKLLAKLQRIFNVRFEIVPQKTIEYTRESRFVGMKNVFPFPKRIPTKRSKKQSVYTPNYTRSTQQKVA